MDVQIQFSVYLINKPGVMATVTEALAAAKINLLALALMDAGEHGALRFVCDNPDKARKVLDELHDRWTEAEVLGVTLDNSPGAFAKITKTLADQNVNVSYAYCSGSAASETTLAVLKVSDMTKAAAVLG